MSKITGNRNYLCSKFLLCAHVLLFCFYTQAKAAEPFSVGQIVENKITLNNGDNSIIFLPPGKHEVAVYHTSGNNNNNRLVRLMLSQIVKQKSGEKIVKNVVSILYSIDYVLNGWQEAKLCDRKNLHFIDSKANYNYEQDCYGLNHYRPTLVGNKKNYIGAFGDNLLEREIRLPQIGLLPFYRFADSSSLIEIHYFFNPEGYGFEAQERTSWKGSTWHPSGISAHPQKVKFKNIVLNWAKKYYPTIKKAAWGKTTQSFKLPDLVMVERDGMNEAVKPLGTTVIEAIETKPTPQAKSSERAAAGERISKEMLLKHFVGRTWIGSTRENAQYIAKINRDGTFYVDVPNRTAESSGSWKIDSKDRYCQDFDAGWSSRCTYFEYIDKLPGIVGIDQNGQKSDIMKSKGGDSFFEQRVLRKLAEIENKVKSIEPVKPPKEKKNPSDSAVSSKSATEEPIIERMKALKKLEDAGLISKEEAAAKRKEILKNL